MTALPAEISVTAPIQPAIERAKKLLFRPFDLGKWFLIGFCAWLAGLGESGMGGYRTSLPFPPGGLSPGAQLPSTTGPQGASEAWEELQGELVRNLSWIVPLAVALVCLIVAFALLMVWLSSRGQFMFLHCVALDRAEVAVPWQQHARAAR